jgi:hypothetical protein
MQVRSLYVDYGELRAADVIDFRRNTGTTAVGRITPND